MNHGDDVAPGSSSFGGAMPSFHRPPLTSFSSLIDGDVLVDDDVVDDDDDDEKGSQQNVNGM